MKLDSKIEWRVHNSCEYLYVDMQSCSVLEKTQISNKVTPIIQAKDLNSVLLVVDIRNTAITIESMRAVKKDWIKTYPHIKKVTLIGVKGSKMVMLKLWNFMMTKSLRATHSIDEAKQFLCP